MDEFSKVDKAIGRRRSDMLYRKEGENEMSLGKRK